MQLASIHLLSRHVTINLVKESLCSYYIRRLVSLALFSHFFGHAFKLFGFLSVMLSEDVIDRTEHIVMVLLTSFDCPFVEREVMGCDQKRCAYIHHTFFRGSFSGESRTVFSVPL